MTAHHFREVSRLFVRLLECNPFAIVPRRKGVMLAFVGALHFGTMVYAAPKEPAQSAAIDAAIKDIGRFKLSAFYFEEQGAALLYLGTQHTFEPENAQIAGIELLFQQFAPTLVLVEGGDWPLAANKDQAIRRYSELGFTRFLAAQSNVPARSADATPDEEFAAVLKQHPPADIKLYYALRYVPQWTKQETSTTVDDMMAKLLASESFSRHFPKGTPPQNLDELRHLAAQRLPAMKDWRTVQFNLAFDGAKQSLLTEIDKTVSGYRNAHIAKAIKASLRQGERVLVISGATHLSKVMGFFAPDSAPRN